MTSRIKTRHPGIYYRIRTDGSKVYYLRLMIGGRQTWRAVGPRLSEAKELWSRLQIEKAEGRLGVERIRKARFRALSAEYLRQYKTRSREWNHPIVEALIKRLNDYFGHLEAGKISAWTVEHYIQYRAGAGVKAVTINSELIYLRAILRAAVEGGYLSRAPKVRTLKVQKTRFRILEDGELDSFLASPLISEAHRAAATIALGAGLRLVEVYMLRPKHVDFARNRINVELSKNYDARSVPMTARVREAIRERFAGGDRILPYASKRIASNSLRAQRRRACRALGISPFRFHDLRHTWATRLIREGVDVRVLMKLGGWRRMETVARYLHSDEAAERAAIAKLEHRDQNMTQDKI